MKKQNTEAVARRCFVKKVFLEILQNSQENNCVRVSFLIKLTISCKEYVEKNFLLMSVLLFIDVRLEICCVKSIEIY